jgi:hypothetical protein
VHAKRFLLEIARSENNDKNTKTTATPTTASPATSSPAAATVTTTAQGTYTAPSWRLIQSALSTMLTAGVYSEVLTTWTELNDIVREKRGSERGSVRGSARGSGGVKLEGKLLAPLGLAVGYLSHFRCGCSFVLLFFCFVLWVLFLVSYDFFVTGVISYDIEDCVISTLAGRKYRVN